jgi:hypothetical protein
MLRHSSGFSQLNKRWLYVKTAKDFKVRIGFFLLAAVVFVIASWPNRAGAQTTTGSIYGTVTDSSGAVVPNAPITVTNTDTAQSLTVTSSNSGDYIFQSLAPGNYRVEAKVAGFGTVTQNDIRLSANQNIQASFSLQPGSVATDVNVNATATLVDTRESQVGETIDQKKIQDLPLNGRDAYDLVQTVAGVTNYAADSPGGTRQGTALSVNGLPSNGNSYYLDGAFDTGIYHVGGNLIPNPDALQEFRILTSNFDAEFGRTPGGVINIITRSGTNQYHGMVYEYLRNDAFNAKSYFNAGVTPLKQNQFGANFGGPIKRDKIFVFGAYEGLRIHTPVVVASGSIVTPTAAEVTGDFTADAAPPAGLSCMGVPNKICPNLLDPVAQALLKFVPMSTIASGYHPAEQNANGNTSVNQVLVRGDDQLTAKQQLSAMYFTSRSNNTTPNVGGNQILSYAGMNNHENQTNAVLSHNWIVTPKAVNSARAFYTLNRYIISNLYGSAHTWTDLPSQVAEGGTIVAPPQIGITGYWTMGTYQSGPSDITQQSIGLIDTFNYAVNNHTIKAGGSFILNKYNETGLLQGSGTLKFTGSTTGNALVDFLEGKANSFVQTNNVRHRVHQVDPALFAQDDWKLTRRLTLNLGVRWEVYPPFAGENNYGTFQAYTQSQRFPTAPLGLLSSGDPGIPDGVAITSWDRFAPRVGFAYDVFGHGTTSLRGGYGIFYSAQDETFNSGLEQQPFTLSITTSKTPNLVTPYAPNSDPFPYNSSSQTPIFTSGATISGLPPHYSSVPYAEEFNLTVEQQLGTNWAARVAYIGNVTRKYPLGIDQNSPVYAPGGLTTTVGLNTRRPYEPTPKTYTFGSISITEPIANSSYNSLQMTVTRRLTDRFSLLASYVWAKQIDIETPLQSQYNITLNRGISGNNIAQRFVASYTYEVPEFKHLGRIGHEVLGGWQLNGVTTLNSGSPFTVLSNVDTNLDGVTSDRPNYLGNGSLGGRGRSEKINGYFNTAAFVRLPANVPYGNEGTNPLTGPGYINSDLSAFKTFSVWEKNKLQFRGEVFNAFNNVNLDNPNATMGSPIEGKITGTVGNPRIVQLAARLMF